MSFLLSRYKRKSNKFFVLLHISLLFLAFQSFSYASDPLSAWENGKNKADIIRFVQESTQEGSSSFVNTEDRIAVFDNDGTLWVENPIFTEERFIRDRLLSIKPVLKSDSKKNVASKSPLKGEAQQLSLGDLQKAVFAAETGVSVDAYNRAVAEWFSEARDPRWNKPYTDLAYLPMVQLLRYLREHGFKTFIVTGGTQKFVRAFAKQVYGLEPYEVIGTTFKTKYLHNPNGQSHLMIEPKLDNLSYRDGKPESIDMFIGKKPIVAFGNSVGDREMLEYTKSSGKSALSFLILHDDAKREYAYGPALGLPPSQPGNEFSQKLYGEAIESGWNIVSMKKDWKKIFAFE